jgi:hypothetical protein
MQNIKYQIEQHSAYLTTLIAGMGLYFLRFESLQVIVNNVSFSDYPIILLISSACLMGLHQITKMWFATTYLNLFYAIGSTVLISTHVTSTISSNTQYIIVPLIFSFFLSASLYVDSLIKEVINSQKKSIKNAKLINKFILFEELGLIIAATAVLSLTKYLDGKLIAAIGVIPIALRVIFFKFESTPRDKFSENKTNQSKNSPVKGHSFVLYAILFVCSIFLLKQLYAYGAYLGFRQLKEAGQDLSTLFAYFNIGQTALIFSILGFKIFFKSHNNSWNNGVKFFLKAQMVIFSVLFFLASPLFLIAGSALRKVLTHTTLNESLKLLHLNYPLNIKNEIHQMASGNANAISYQIVAGVAYIIGQEGIDLKYLWLFAMAITLLAFQFRKKLFQTLTEHHVSNLLQKNIYEAVNACYSLAYKEANIYALSLGHLLERNPRPMLSKAIIYTLGEMQHPSSIDLLISQYNKTDREDIQLCIIQSVMRYESHKVNLFLLECLEEMILNQTSLGEIRRTIFQQITKKINMIAIPMTLRLLKNHQDNPRVVANIILIIGELAIDTKDENLFELLIKHTAPNFSRRIRSNAFIYLYANKKHRSLAMSGITDFIISADEHDKSAAAFLAGELNLKGMYHYVKQLSMTRDHKVSTIELALLKLGDKEAAGHISDIIFQNEKDALTCLNQLNSISRDSLRYQVYDYIIDHYADKLGMFMKFLSDTRRNFDDDRRKIYATCIERNVIINDKEFLFESQIQEITTDTKQAA